MKQEALDKQIVIEGKFVTHYENIKINQYLHTHHTFEVELDLEVVEEAGSHTLEESKKWLGKQLTTNVSGKAFIGIILDISLKHDRGHHGRIVLKGASQTILLENGKQQQSWIDRDLTRIIKELLARTPIKNQIKPLYDALIPYQCQYLESDFQYLQRLAQHYNEWFYFNGVDLVFGKPTNNEEVLELQYGREITEIELQVQTYQPHMTTYGYNAFEDKEFGGDSIGTREGLNELGNHALRASKELHKNTKQTAPSDFILEDKASLDDYLKRRMQSFTAGGTVLVAKSTQKSLRIGTVIKVSSAKWEDSTHEIKKYGEYIITEIEHTAGGIGGSYTNSFKALPAGIQSLPFNNALPSIVAYNQIATVVSNKDPKQKGRVQVRMQWQIEGMKTNWIRVMTPDAGKSELTATNRGFVFIPEEGDQVMISFEHNDPNRPFVLGSLFTGKTGAGGGDNNIKKSIVTRGGHMIELDDTKGKEKITIKDKDGSIVAFDTKAKSLFVQSAEKIEFTAKNIVMNTEENIQLNAKKNVEVSTEEDAKIVSQGKIQLQSDSDTTIKSKSNLALEATSDATIKGDKAIVEGQSSAELNGAQTKVTGSAMAEVSGGMVKIN